MKVLHIIPNLSKGGAERLVIDIMKALSNKKEVEAKLIILRNDINYDISDIKDLVEVVLVKVKLSIFKKNKLNVADLQKSISEFKPDIIHTHLFEAEITSRSCYYPKAVWFSHCHDNMIQFKNFSFDTLKNKSTFTNFFEKKYLFSRYDANNGTQFIAISNNAKEYFENKISGYPITLLLNAINFDKFFIEKENKKYSKSIKLINVGSFVDKKNQQFLITIAEKLKEKNIEFELHLLGDGKNIKAIEQKSRTLNLKEHIFFYGNVNNVEEHLWQSDIYVHSATYEPLGLVLLEAMAAGLPVISLDGGGNRDLIEEGKNGFMIYEQNPDLFVDAIVKLWQDKKKYQSISKYAQQYAKQYDIKNYVDKLMDIYKQALAKKATLEN